MAKGVSVSLVGFSEFKKKFAEFKKKYGSKRVLEKVATAFVKAWEQYFIWLDGQKSQYGHKFYIDEGAKKVKVISVNNRHAVVAEFSAPMAHKLFGGKVVPKNSQNIAIPITENAKRLPRGTSVRDAIGAEKTKYIRVGRGAIFGTRDGVYLWKLQPSVVHRGFEYVLPSGSSKGKQMVNKEIKKALKELSNESK